MNRRMAAFWPGVVIAVALAVAFLAPLRPANAAVEKAEFPVTTALNSDQLAPEVSGDIAVWQEHRNGNADIYLRNLKADGTESPVTTAPGDQVKPDISGDIVVWEDRRNGDSDVYARRLSNPATPAFPITTAPGDQRKPRIDGDFVVWEDNRGGDWDIYRYDLNSQQEARVTTDPSDQRRPAISDNTLVWEDLRNGTFDIYGIDLRGGTEFPVSVERGWQDTPAISGDTVVWRDERNGGNYDIYGKNLSTGEEFPVVAALGDQWAPAISEGIVVWTDSRGGNSDVYGKSLATGREGRITSGSNSQEDPAIDGETVVWEAQRNSTPYYGTYDIYGAEIYAPTTLSLTASPQTLAYGAETTLSGSLVSNGGFLSDAGALSGREVVLEQRPAGADTFSPLPGAQLTTDAAGRFSLAGVKPAKNTDYRVRFVGDRPEGLSPSTSSLERTGVQPLVSASTSTKRVMLGKVVTIWGTILPVETGTVKLTIKRNGQVIATKSVSLSSSRYQLAYKPPAAGGYEVYASFVANADYVGNTSMATNFSVVGRR